MAWPVEQAMPVLYVLCDQWVRERQLLRALGVEKPGLRDLSDTVYTGRRTGSLASRMKQVLAAGGEVG